MKPIILAATIVLLAFNAWAAEEAGNWPVGRVFEDVTKSSQIDTDMANSDINDPQCVKQSEAIAAWDEAFNNSFRLSNQTFPMSTTLECDPCKCPEDFFGSGTSCYEFLLKQHEEIKAKYERQKELLERAKAHGICE